MLSRQEVYTWWTIVAYSFRCFDNGGWGLTLATADASLLLVSVVLVGDGCCVDCCCGCVLSLSVRRLLRTYLFSLGNHERNHQYCLACKHKLRRILLFHLQQSFASSVPSLLAELLWFSAVILFSKTLSEHTRKLLQNQRFIFWSKVMYKLNISLDQCLIKQ